MSYYYRSITYIHSYRKEQCIENSGYVKWLVRDGICSFHITHKTRNIPCQITICLLDKQEHPHRISTLSVSKPCSDYDFTYPQDNMEDLKFGQVAGLYIYVDCPAASTDSCYAVSLFAGNRPIVLPEVRLSSANSVWQSLLSRYPVIHPLKNEMDYLSISPKDLTLLPSAYQSLCHNSFLLHGFYNYRHLILGQYENRYCIGVPGTYHPREAQVAAMFGFPKFTEVCEHMIGAFGYYLTPVELPDHG